MGGLRFAGDSRLYAFKRVHGNRSSSSSSSPSKRSAASVFPSAVRVRGRRRGRLTVGATRSLSMPNHLAKETSPYLLQHKDNPVDWYPWGEQALAKARAEAKPIFLSIGYSSCHWCHVMEHESFENESIAGLLNEHFVS